MIVRTVKMEGAASEMVLWQERAWYVCSPGRSLCLECRKPRDLEETDMVT